MLNYFLFICFYNKKHWLDHPKFLSICLCTYWKKIRILYQGTAKNDIEKG